MNTQEYEAKIQKIIQSLRATIVRVTTSMAGRDDNKGTQFKINAGASRKGTIALRCNHVHLESVSSYMDDVVRQLTVQDTLPLLELISINKAYEMDVATQRKREIPSKRTIFITFRPPQSVYNKLLELLPNSKENYMRTTELLDVLENLK